MKRSSLVLVLIGLLVVSFPTAAFSGEKPERVTEVPETVGEVNWDFTPSQSQEEKDLGRGMVWTGLVEDMLMEAEDDKVSVVLICRHLSFSEPGPQAIAMRPIQARETKTGFFGVFFDIYTPMDEVVKLKEEIMGETHYVLAAGVLDSVVKLADQSIPLLMPHSMEINARMVQLESAQPGGEQVVRLSPEVVQGEGHAFSIAPPKGWVLDNQSGLHQGLQAVFYPSGSSWKHARSVMYVNTDARKPGQRVESYIESELKDFSREFGEEFQAREWEAIKTSDAKWAHVRRLSGDTWGNYESIAYIEENGVFVLIVLTARDEQSYKDSQQAFEELVKSYRFVQNEAQVSFE